MLSEGIKYPSPRPSRRVDLENRITGSKITTADEPGRGKRPGPGCAKTHLQGYQNRRLRRKSPFSFGNLVKAAKKVASGTHPAQGMPWQASPPRPHPTDNGTPAQPQSQTMGAARRGPPGSESLGADSQVRSCMTAQAWGSGVEYRQQTKHKTKVLVLETAGTSMPFSLKM